LRARRRCVSSSMTAVRAVGPLYRLHPHQREMGLESTRRLPDFQRTRPTDDRGRGVK
jgi:hypothetical protein